MKEKLQEKYTRIVSIYITFQSNSTTINRNNFSQDLYQLTNELGVREPKSTCESERYDSWFSCLKRHIEDIIKK